MTLEALIFGGVGSLVECADLDRDAWNSAFRTHGIDWQWSFDTYAELLREGGDRQLAARYASYRSEIIDAEAIDKTHQRVFAAKLSSNLPLRPGVARVMKWAMRAGMKVGFVSRIDLDPARAILSATARERGGMHFDVAIMRDDVSHFAPDPEAMTLAIQELGVGAGRSIVVADTAVTARSAQAAGLPVLAFPGKLGELEPDAFGTLPKAHVLSPEALTSAWRDDDTRTAAE